MSKTEKDTEAVPAEAGAVVRVDKRPKPAKSVDNVKNARDFKAKWDNLKKQDGRARVSVPGTDKTIEFKHVEVVDNRVSIWTSSDTSLPPDFVVVNGPTEIQDVNGVSTEDHLTAIAIAIDGATK